MNLSQMFENGFDKYSIEDPNEITTIDEKTGKTIPLLLRASKVKASMLTNSGVPSVQIYKRNLSDAANQEHKK